MKGRKKHQHFTSFRRSVHSLLSGGAFLSGGSKCCVFFACVLFVFSPGDLLVKLSAQQRSCGLNHASKKEYLEHFHSVHSSFFKENGDTRVSNRSNQYAPLVFHIITEEGREPVTVEEIEAQIEVLNKSFNGRNADLGTLPDEFRPDATVTGIQFCLAYHEDGTELKPAVFYRTTDIPFAGEEMNLQGKPIVKYTALGGLDARDPSENINIWIAELRAYQGYTTLPGEQPNNESGIVIDPDFFGYHPDITEKRPYHLGKTLVHEMGHYFGLLHPWGLVESCESDDGIEDTPVQEYIYYGCPQHPQYSCGSADMFMNFMNFTDDPCLIFFTEGQKAWMLQMIDKYYPGLLQNKFCRPVDTTDSAIDEVTITQKIMPPLLILERLTPDKTPVFYQVFDISGKSVARGSFYAETKKDIYLNNISAGVYVLLLHDAKKNMTRKYVFF